MARLIRLLNTRATRTIILAFLILLCLLTKPVCVDPKGAPTDFSCLPDFSEWPSNIQLPRQLVRRQQGSSALDIDDRYLFVRELGSGREGIVRLYWDTSTGDSVAIKAFHSKYRNPVPARVFEALKAENVHYWPTEIQATILLGVSTLRNDDTGSSPKCGVETWSLDMLLALDYFLVHGTPLPSATILAKGRLPIWQKSLEVENQTFNDLDLSLRPTLHRFLGSLARMHKIGLCHNDIKPDNIYVKNHQWLLGDMGNVREIHHHYYSIAQWHHEGQWADCQTNDVRRALVSYMNFIRRASANRESFDQQFFCRSSPLSQLYWEFMAEPISANELQDKLTSGHQNTSIEGFKSCPYPQKDSFWSLRKPLVSNVVSLVLRWSTVPGKWKFWID